MFRNELESASYWRKEKYIFSKPSRGFSETHCTYLVEEASVLVAAVVSVVPSSLAAVFRFSEVNTKPTPPDVI